MRQGTERRLLLSRTEHLLSAVEDINFGGGNVVPEDLVQALVQAAADVEAADGLQAFRRPRGRVTTEAAQSYLFRLQERILGSPEQEVRIPAARASVAVQVRPVKRGEAESDAQWRDWLKAQGQRAWDRWSLLDHQARRARDLALRGGEHELQTVAVRTAQARIARTEWEGMREAVSDLLGIRFQPEREVAGLAVSTRLLDRGVSVDLATGRVRGSGAGTRCDLTATEARVLSLLVARPGRVLSREGVTRALHGDDPNIDSTGRCVDVHLSNIRQKLGPLRAALVVVPRAGWKWTGPSATPAPRSMPDRAPAQLRAVTQSLVANSSSSPGMRPASQSASRCR